jgi:hypothetical protein
LRINVDIDVAGGGISTGQNATPSSFTRSIPMRRILFVTAAILVAVGWIQAAETDQVDQQLKVPSDRANAVTYALGEHVKISGKVYADEFFGKSIVNANPTVANNADHPVRAVLHIAFLDGDGQIVGVISQGSELKPGESTQYGSCLAEIPEDQISKIASLQAKLYAHEIDSAD